MSGIVTDELVLRMLAQQGIDKDYVEFWHDYAHRDLGKEYNPYAKFYRDLKSGQKIMAVGGLPMVNADGVKICGDNHNETKVGWELSGGKYLTKPNIFTGTIDGLGVELITINDQPWGGVNKGDSASWEPRLFLNGVEQFCGAVALLPVDPVNPNYHNNVLEWDYGICKRRIRIIEGRFRERWIFPANPNGDVRIKHNFLGQYKPRLTGARDARSNPLETFVTGDEELVPASAFAEAVYPVEIGASETFYPDAHVETSTVDGYTSVGIGVPFPWLTLRARAGDDALDDGAGEIYAFFRAVSTPDEWNYITRAPTLFNSEGLPDICTIIAATESIYGESKADPSNNLPTCNIYACNPASNTELVPTDYATFEDTAFCDTPLTYAGWNLAGYNDFVFNATGIAAISKTGVSKFGLRNTNYDVTGIAPTWGDDEQTYQIGKSSEDGAGFKPKLVVTYTVPAVISGSVFGNTETERGSILINRDTERPGVLSSDESPGGSIFSNVESERSSIRGGRE